MVKHIHPIWSSLPDRTGTFSSKLTDKEARQSDMFMFARGLTFEFFAP